jgi:hypothetical protein
MGSDQRELVSVQPASIVDEIDEARQIGHDVLGRV